MSPCIFCSETIKPNQTKEMDRANTLMDNRNIQSITLFTFGPGRPIPVSPWIPGGPVGPRSPCDHTHDNTQHTLLSLGSSFSPFYTDALLKLKQRLAFVMYAQMLCVITGVHCGRYLISSGRLGQIQDKLQLQLCSKSKTTQTTTSDTNKDLGSSLSCWYMESSICLHLKLFTVVTESN